LSTTFTPEFTHRTPRILITGASGGIGRDIAVRLGRGAKVGLHYHSDRASSIDETAKAIYTEGGEALPLQADVTQSEDVCRIVDDFVQWSGGIDILINNAGALLSRVSIEEMSLDTWNQSFALNTGSVFLFTKAVIPAMKKQATGGAIINISSIAAVTGGSSRASHYASAKAAVSCFTLAAAKELAPHNIRVNAVAPGFIETPFHDGITDPAVMKQVELQTPLQRNGTARDISDAVSYLASSSAAFVTGTVLDVNGGLLMRG
jgi:3-oxoacyl-[acyl-carrier protein] reductase